MVIFPLKMVIFHSNMLVHQSVSFTAPRWCWGWGSQEAPSPKLLIYTEVFRWSSLKTQDAAKTSPCMHVLVQTPEEDCVQDVLDRFFVETAVQDPFVRISFVQKVPCLWHHTGSDVHFLTHPTVYGPDVQVKFIHPYCKHVWYRYVCWKNQWQCLFFFSNQLGPGIYAIAGLRHISRGVN